MRSEHSCAGIVGRFLKFVFLILLGLFVLGGVLFGFEFFEATRDTVLMLGVPNIANLPILDLRPQPTRANAPNIAAGERVNLLILGIDRRPSERCPCRTDTMMIATLDPKTLTAGLVTIPRDLYVPIPDVGENRINTASFYGELKYPGGGPVLAKKTVEYNLGRKIHFYVLLDFNGFRRVVDTLGGIDIDVPRTIDDSKYPDENFGYKPIHIPAGRVHMNGELALEYARTRHVDGDFGRAKRQIQILMAMREKALRLDLLPKLPGLVQSMWGIVETDMQPQDVIVLAAVAVKVKTENIKTASIDQTMTVEFRTSNSADVLWPDRVKIGQLIDQIIPPENTAADQSNRVHRETARVLILNGTHNPALGEQTAKFLQAQGFEIVAFGNADRFDYPKTVLIDYSGAKNASMTTLAQVFRVDPENIRRATNIKSDVDIRLILGADWTPPAEKTQP